MLAMLLLFTEVANLQQFVYLHRKAFACYEQQSRHLHLSSLEFSLARGRDLQSLQSTIQSIDGLEEHSDRKS
jgi:hypothetical protein